MTMEIDAARLIQILQMLSKWQDKKEATKKEVESLVGLLNFVAKCVRPSRIFMQRMYDFIRDMPAKGKVKIPDEFALDLQWWHTYLPTYNGVSLIPELTFKPVDSVIVTDACLQGCGGLNLIKGEFFHSDFPQGILEKNLHINILELLTIMIAIKLWGKELTGHRFQMRCDNSVAVSAMNMHRVRNPDLQAIMREIVFWQCIYQIEVYTTHIEGAKNDLADALSRWNTDHGAASRFQRANAELLWTETSVEDSIFQYSGKWL